jgi:GNAT superfamily N-acetyltransferase
MDAGRQEILADEMRLATPADVPAIVELYRGLSPFSQRMRFSTCMSEETLLRAAFLDERVDAVLALSAGRVIGEARLDTGADSDHEFAVTVADDAQGRGLGAALLDRLRERAAEAGIVTLRAQVRIDNVPMLTLLRRVGGAIVMVADGDVLLDIASDREMPGWPADRSPRRVLVEASGAMERPITTALRAAGYDVRQCAGPTSGRREPCPLLAGGSCRLATEADAIICLLPDNAESRAVVSAHALDRVAALAAGLALSGR